MKFLKLTLLIFAGLMIGLSACDKDASQDIRGEDGNPKTGGGNGSGGGNGNGGNGGSNKPSISFQEKPGKIVKKGDSVSFKLTVESSSSQTNLKNLMVEIMAKASGDQYKAFPKYDDSISFAPVPTTGTQTGFRVSNADFNAFDSIKVKFTLNDKADKSLTKNYIFAIGSLFKDKYIAAGGDTVISIYHKYTANPSLKPKTRYDLYYYENNTTQGYVPGAGNKATIMDDSKDSSTFNRRWTTATSAKFVKANGSGIDYQKPFDIQIEQAYKKGDPTKTLINLSSGDLIVVKLRKQGRLALLKIVNVVEDQQNKTQSYISFKGKGKDIR